MWPFITSMMAHQIFPIPMFFYNVPLILCLGGGELGGPVTVAEMAL